jgi:putative addiction module CopG family antidote
MAIQLSPETERLVEQQIASGRFHSVDEIIEQGIKARNEEDEVERMHRRRKALEHMREYIENPIPLNGITIQELMEEGRRR